MTPQIGQPVQHVSSGGTNINAAVIKRVDSATQVDIHMTGTGNVVNDQPYVQIGETPPAGSYVQELALAAAT